MASPAAEKLFEQIELLESELQSAYERLGAHLPHRPVRTGKQVKQLPMRMNWLRHDVEDLEERVKLRMGGGRQERDARKMADGLRHLLGRLSPASISRDLSLMFMTGSEEVDPFGMDPQLQRRLDGFHDFLFQKYWRVEVEGLEHVPAEGAAVLVGNHAGLLPFDAAMAMHAVKHFHPAGRTVRFLIEDWFYHFPILSVLINRLGMVRASSENAERLLRGGQLIGVFPEGVQGVSKTYRERYRVQRFGRGGTVRLCIRTGAAAVPMAIVGSEETYPLLGNSKFLARMTDFGFFPITPLFPWLGPLGLIPLPSKWTIRFGEPVPFNEFNPEDAEDDILVGTLNEDLRERVQLSLRQILSSRRGAFTG